ncbi:hypothetical protein ACQP2P_12025 [Dactylosporangium sp. CA-139114]|uniref:hypothetical protein n=1 Tax=Dactylosporangium sp. CA-139114 TaxID=3239931 RepID=UPI003D97CAA9
MDAAQLRGVSLRESPIAMPGVLAPELLSDGRVVPAPAPIPHGSYFTSREKLQLAHTRNYPRIGPKTRPRAAPDRK